jgi:hypothetical protein
MVLFLGNETMKDEHAFPPQVLQTFHRPYRKNTQLIQINMNKQLNKCIE